MADDLISLRLGELYQLFKPLLAAEPGFHGECGWPPSVVPADIPAHEAYLGLFHTGGLQPGYEILHFAERHLYDYLGLVLDSLLLDFRRGGLPRQANPQLGDVARIRELRREPFGNRPARAGIEKILSVISRNRRIIRVFPAEAAELDFDVLVGLERHFADVEHD